MAGEMEAAGYTEAETATMKAEVEHYEKVRQEVKIASGDYVDLKRFEPAMRHLLDTYIHAEESEKVSALDDHTLIEILAQRGAEGVDVLPSGIRGSQKAVAETIENNLRRMILSEKPLNPVYYERMSVLLDGLIEERRKGALDYKTYLERVAEQARQVLQPEGGTSYPPAANTPGKRALYDNLGQDEVQALAVHEAVQAVKKHGFRGDLIMEREIKGAIYGVMQDAGEAERLFQIIESHKEY